MSVHDLYGPAASNPRGATHTEVLADTGAQAGKREVAWHARVTAAQWVHYSLGYRVED